MKYDFHTIVIGAGSAGLSAASILANLGAKVALIEKNKMGGDCLNTGCVPSKSLLHQAEKQGLSSANGSFARAKDERSNLDEFRKISEENFNRVTKRINQTIGEIAPHDSEKRFEDKGVTVLKGSAKFLDEHRIQISLNGNESEKQVTGKKHVDNKKQVISGKNIVLATGSKPRVPKLEGLEGFPYLTNENLFSLEKLPKRFIIWGGGPISMEIGQAFGKLGSEVIIISRGQRLFKKDEPEVYPVMKEVLEKEGINFYFGYEPTKIEATEGKNVHFNLEIKNRETGEEDRISGDQFLIALGRISATDELGLEKAEIEVDERGYIKVNEHLQTSKKNIYACGDVLGDYQFTHMAGYEAEIVSRNILSPIKTIVDYSKVVWTTYTKPQVAHSGYTEASAKEAGKFGKVLIKTFEDVDRNIIEGDTQGFVKLILDSKDRVIGGTVVANEAGEMIGMVSLAISKNMKISVFQGLIYSYPTKSEVFKSLAVKNLQGSVQPWQRNLLKKWLSRNIN